MDTWNEERMRLINEKESNDFYQGMIADYEEEIKRLRDIKLNEIDESESRNLEMLNHDIENYQHQVKTLEDSKERMEIKYKDTFAKFQSDIKEVEQFNKELKEGKKENEKEINNLKSHILKIDKELTDKTRIEIAIKEKEIIQLKDKIEFIISERDNLLKEYDALKKTYDKTRGEYIELNEKLKNWKETNGNEIRKIEEKYSIMEKRFESEKNILIEANKDLNQKLMALQRKSVTSERLNTLSKMLDDEDENNTNQLEEEILSLRVKLNESNNKINECNTKLANFQKLLSEIDILKRENTKLTNNIKELREMYENQIEELDHKNITINSELNNNRRRTTRAVNQQQIGILSDLEASVNNLTADNKFLSDKIHMLTKEIDNQKVLREKDVEYLKKELRMADDATIKAKVELATLAFEKDSEIIRVRNICKKLKAKLTGNPLMSPVKSPVKKTVNN
jgi:chromosome segregation ATPase